MNNTISFGKSRVNQYTPNQIRIMKVMKRAAIDNKWLDIYTGEPFSTNNLPTIEHVIPFSLKKSGQLKGLIYSGFELNGLDNIFPAGSLGNSNRQSDRFKKTVAGKPIILDRLLIELEKYRLFKSELINGADWFKRLSRTLTQELSGISCDVNTRIIC